MKRLFILLAAVLMTASVMAEIDYPQYRDVNHNTDTQVRYKLYPTFNMWTFLKLDTRTGIITQVQYSTTGNDVECLLGAPTKGLSEEGKNGRYELYPTQNNWTFILLDQVSGKAYHVQWSQDKDKRMVFEIQYSFLD